MRLNLLLLCAFVCSCAHGYSQNLLSQALQATGLQKQATDGIHSVSDKSLHFLQTKYGKMRASIDKQSKKMLVRMQVKEKKLEQKLKRKDIAEAAVLFSNAQGNYKDLKARFSDSLSCLKKKLPLANRLFGADSLLTALHRLPQSKTILSQEEQKEMNEADSTLKSLQAKLMNKMSRKDSGEAVALLSSIEKKCKGLQVKLPALSNAAKKFPLTEYIPGIDSMQTALRFLQNQQGLNLSTAKLAEISKTGDKLQTVQGKLQKANEIESFVKERERQLKEQLQNKGLGKQLKSINKEAFYYSKRLKEYKDLLTNKEKLEQKVLGVVRESPLFKSFMQKNSYLSKLFPTPQNYGTLSALAGLQTRSGVQQALQQRFGMATTAGAGSTAGSNSGSMEAATGYVQQQMSAAQAQLVKLKNKMGKLGIDGGSSDMTMPDFKPNDQHIKSFLQRIEYGVNIQSEQSHSVIPATSEAALTAGYKINDKSTIGVGASYRMGWGHEGIKHIKLSSEGVGLRSYVDIKAKGNIWISGGYEMNYMQAFTKYRQLYDINVWQRSGLIGIKKKYKVGKKENNVQVLWDFLSYQQIPRTQAIKFRVGFSL